MPRILIVDDEKENLQSLTRALSDENPRWKILTASSEIEGMAILKRQLSAKEPIDVVLTE